MSAAIVLTGLSSNYWLPNIYIETNFAQGPALGAGLVRTMVVLANKTSAGSAVVDTTIYGPDSQVPLQTESDMIALGGTGSEAHRMFRRISQINQVTPVYWVFVTESAGTAASGTIVLSGGAPTGNGNLRIWVADEYVDTSLPSGTAIDTIGAAAVANINAMSHWPVTASYNAGTDTITITAKQKGPRGNWLRFMAAITSGIGTAVTATTDAFLSGGATADSLTTALATILPRSFYYVVPAAEDATQLGAVASQVTSNAQPTIGIRQRVVSGSVDTYGNAVTVATGLNNPRVELVWSEKNPLPPSELAASMAALYMAEEIDSTNPRTNFINYGVDPVTSPKWKIPVPRVATAHPSRATLNSAGANGLSPIAVNDRATKTYLVDRITTRCLNGAIPDFRIRDAHKVTITDYFADALYRVLVEANAGKRIGDDPPEGQAPPSAEIVTPQAVRLQVAQVINDFESYGLLQNVDAIRAGVVVQRETNPTSRMGIRVPLATVDNFRQGAVALDQVA